jgi:predicted nucleic acid-binding protein
LLANVALALEYEAVCKRPEHVLASGLSWGEVDIFLTAVVSMVEPVTSHFLWRPHLRDPSDEMVLEAAVNGQATAIITFNPRDFAGVAAQFGIDILPPRDGSRRLTS